VPPVSPTRYQITVEGWARAVELDEVGAADGSPGVTRLTRITRIAIDGHERMVDARSLGNGLWSVLDGHTVRLLQVSGTGPKVTVEVGSPDGEPRSCVVEVSAAPSTTTQAAAAVESGPASLRAPIPGRLVKILVKAGDRVTAGQPLLVLEAMKMENEVRAPRAGTVKAVHASEGVAVETGQLLISLD
jgi:glutaconyl-CoA/methylmalonyl-CoA decarboxylase subunit gamma